MIRRTYLLQEKLREQKLYFQQQFEIMEAKYDEKLAEMALQIAELNAANDELGNQVEDHERRIQRLEGPKNRMMQLIRTMEEHKMQMLASNKNPEEFDQFHWVLPNDALLQASDEAIENGLLSAIEIGTMANLRSLTSIRLLFNNGKKDF